MGEINDAISTGTFHLFPKVQVSGASPDNRELLFGLPPPRPQSYQLRKLELNESPDPFRFTPVPFTHGTALSIRKA